MLDIGLSVAKIGRTSVTYNIGVFREQEEQAAAVGTFVHVFVDPHTRRPVEHKGKMRQALEVLQATQSKI